MCKNCHSCGNELKSVLDGEEWCNFCEQYRRYSSHGWGASGIESPCLPPDVISIMDYYRSDWLNDNGKHSPASDILEGYRDLAEAKEALAGFGDRDIAFFTARGDSVSPAALKWAIEYQEAHNGKRIDL
jgi:hypothetical protein